jgi:L-malate glycosyltransferase
MRDKALSVLMVMESVFPTPAGGGAESQVLTLSQGLSARNVTVKAVVPMVSGGPQVAYDEVHGLAVVRLRYPKVYALGAAWLLLSLAWYLLRTCRRYQVIHAHIAGNMAAVCSLMGCLLGKPVLVKLTGLTEVQGGVLAERPGLASRLRKAAVRRARTYQATSSRMASMLVERGFDPLKVRCVPNAVNTERFACIATDPLERAALRDERRLVGIFVGRLAQEKGLDHLLLAWASVFRDRQDARLMIIGGGNVEADLRALACTLGIDDQVAFFGATRQVEKYLACADFGLLPSLHEGLSNTLLEYMAAGLPVLGSRVSGTEDFVVAHRTGWLFPPGEVEALAGCLSEVADSTAAELARLGASARELVTQRASIGAVVDRLLSVYAERRHAANAVEGGTR